MDVRLKELEMLRTEYKNRIAIAKEDLKNYNKCLVSVESEIDIIMDKKQGTLL